MEFEFNGRARSVYTHKHELQKLKWRSATKLDGTLNNLGLSGNFDVSMSFSVDEMAGWLELFVKDNPA